MPPSRPASRPRRPSPGAPTLILIPTELERARWRELGGLPSGLGLFETCGFGVVAAAARTSQRLAQLAPRRVVLVGIAGSLDCAALPVESATSFGFVRLHGLGAEGGAHGLLPPSALGFPQWPAQGDASEAIWEEVALATPAPEARARGLLTVCAATADPEGARALRERQAGVLAEDMEAFGVALACALAGTPLTVVRGISNEVGDRDVRGWRISQALEAARDELVRLLRLEARP